MVGRLGVMWAGPVPTSKAFGVSPVPYQKPVNCSAEKPYASQIDINHMISEYDKKFSLYTWIIVGPSIATKTSFYFYFTIVTNKLCPVQ
jgi:hypothetical protein